MLTLKQDTMLGNIPKDWDVKALKKLLEFNAPGDWGNDGGPHMFRVLRSTNLTNERRLDFSDTALRALKPEKAKQLAPRKGDILLERSGGGPNQPVGRVGYVADNLPGHAFSNFLHLLRPDAAEVEPSYLSWVLYRVNTTGRILRLEQQTTQMRNLNFRDYLTMPLPVPPPDEQIAIARVLDAVDVTIVRAQEAVIETRELQMAVVQDFFYSALGVTAYADHPSQKLPVGWQLAPMESLLAEDPKNGVSPQATSQPPGTPTFSIAAVRDGKVDLTKANNLKYAKVSEQIAEKYRIHTGDVLIVRGNANPDLVGKAGRVNEFPEGCIYPDITKRVVFRRDGDNTVSPEYAVLAWNHSIIHNQVLRRAKTSNGTLKINNRDVKQIVMPVPPPSSQLQIVELVAALDAKTDALKQKLLSLEQLKKSLMQDLLTGKVRIAPSLFEKDASR
ncbi:restriction endonuclease subunit S [Pseudomonas taiwanensis]|uniref:restriction endonuclease subunit S n=1 Tax=Pseudomonas taiwanensis TaxID=470150 RepID=UPI0016446AB6|nr:restriction endonuclease subunit S [Pseudomonas taiwanensis]MBC3493630.1 restriction endonuclease subunit S [Pseudomonas taiwanensis]